MPFYSASQRPYNVLNQYNLNKLKLEMNNCKMNNMHKRINKIEIPSYIQTNTEFIDYISYVNTFKAIFEEFSNVNDGEEFGCLIKENNIAWVEKDAQGRYRYFTKTVKAKNAVALTIVDLLILLSDEAVSSQRSYLMARRELARLLDVNYDEYAWEKTQMDKYSRNMQNIEKILLNKSDDLSVDKRFLSNSIVFHQLNQLGLYYLSTKENNIDGEALFSFSYRELMAVLDLDYKSLKQSLDWLIKNGFIRRFSINYEKFPKRYRQKLQDMNIAPTFYTIPLLKL